MTFKALHVITGLGDGGAEAVLFRLVTAPEFDVQHVVVSLGDSGKYGELLEAYGVKVFCLGMPRGGVKIGGLRNLIAILRRERPDVVQTWMYHANFLGGLCARAAGLSNIVWGIHHTHLLPGMASRGTRLVDWLCARISPFVPSSIVACAQAARDVHVLNGYDERKFHVVANGYDVGRWSRSDEARQEIRAELGIPDRDPVVGLVARWDPLKDHDNLLSALALVRPHFPGVRLVLAGQGCEAENGDLAFLVGRAGGADKTYLLGPRSDVPNIMNALDLHVLSSRSEAFPNVVAEAMACETPCVVTEVGDAPVIVGTTGWSVPIKNAQLLANAIIAALAEWSTQPTAWSTRRDHARQRIASNFSVGAMAAGYRSVWMSSAR